VVIIVVLACLVGAVVLVGPSGSGITKGQVEELSDFRDACAQWDAALHGQSPPPAEWCTNLTSWMAKHVNHNQGSWTSTTSVRSLCERWTKASPSEAISNSQNASWCNEMVVWLEQHATLWRSLASWTAMGSLAARET
jgi:hypothetical protein